MQHNIAVAPTPGPRPAGLMTAPNPGPRPNGLMVPQGAAGPQRGSSSLRGPPPGPPPGWQAGATI